MGRWWIIPVYFIYLLVISLVAESIMFSMNNGEIITASQTLEEDTSLMFVWNMLVFIFSMFTFQVVGLPVIVNLVFFWLPPLGVIFGYIIPVIRGV